MKTMITKRNGKKVEFKREKIENAIKKAAVDAGVPLGAKLGVITKYTTDAVIKSLENVDEISVELVQDMVERALMDNKFFDVAKEYILYREKRNEVRHKPWEMTDMQRDILNKKYLQPGETFDQWIERVSNGDDKLAKLIRDKKFLFAGRILSNRGLQHKGTKVTFSNCYVCEPPSDSIEGIYEAAYKLARTFSYGGGIGVDVSKLRPKNATVHNAAKTTSGAVSFMELFNMTTSIIGQNGRRGALMISMSVDHPDIEEFIDIKTQAGKIEKANISVRITDEFMQAVINNEQYDCRFEIEEHNEVIGRVVNARELFMKLCENNWQWAEPGILYWDTISNWNLMSGYEDFEYAGVNPCAEEPLPAGGSCLLGSINLAEFVKNPFMPNASIDIDGLMDAIETATIALNDVLDEGLELHPLEEQRKTVSELRQIGLGTMGLADMLLKLNVRYGSKDAVSISDLLSSLILNTAVQTSALLAKERGSFDKYDYDKLSSSEFFQKMLTDKSKKMIEKYGLRNSQLTCLAPTGTISTMLGVSGGIEPIFNTSYVRKTESLHDEDVYYKVYTPVVKEFMEMAQITDESLLPETFVTAMTLSADERIAMQAAWQKNIDASISSTINLPNEATVEDVYGIYINAWKHGLKGVTVYRDGCARGGVLINEKKLDKKIKVIDNLEIKKEETSTICPECGAEITNTGGCGLCLSCGYSKCN